MINMFLTIKQGRQNVWAQGRIFGFLTVRS